MIKLGRLTPMAIALLLGACQSLPPSMTSWLPSSTIPILTPEFWGFKVTRPGPLPEFQAKLTAKLDWQVSLGSKGKAIFAPAIVGDAIYAAGPDGTIVRVEALSGKEVWRAKADKPLQAGVGASATKVIVGTNKGDVLTFDTAGKPGWNAKVSTEVAGPPKISEGKVIVWTLDAKITALSEEDGSAKWSYTGTSPPLTVRRFVGGSVARGALFTGTAGGKLLAFDVNTGTLGWQASVATSKGSNELERIADVASLPLIDERQVCAAAYQGRVACFEVINGNLTWSRDLSSLSGIAIDQRYLYLTDDKGAVHALDKITGASVWKQEKLATRFPSGPVLIGTAVGVVDIEGYLHLLDREDGALVGRVATDGSGPLSQPMPAAESAVWQTLNGNLISASAK